MAYSIDLNKLLSQMTLEEKVCQLVQLGTSFFTKDKTEITGIINQIGLGDEARKRVGSTLGAASVESVVEVQKKHMEDDPNKIPLLFMKDVIHGYRTIYPIPLALGCSFNADIVAECTRVAAREASLSGIHVTFTPMVDYVRDPRWGRVMETCGEDPYLNGVMGATQVKAFQGDDVSEDGNIVACVKHFAAYGGAEAGRDYADVELSEHVLREYYFPAYKACIDAGVKMLMPSFNNLNGVPSTANKWLMNKILREEWGFDGIVISDHTAIQELIVHGVAANLEEASKLAFECGCHIDMMSPAYYDALGKLVEKGVITEKQIDEYVLKILELKKELGLFDNPFKGLSVEEANKSYLCPEHMDVVCRAAQESAVLIKNDGVLPFGKGIKKLAIIGPFAKEQNLLGSWSASGKPEECITVEDGIKDLIPDVEILYAKGCSAIIGDTDTSDIENAVNMAKSADAVLLCLGEPALYSGEGKCRVDITLPGMQTFLTEAVAAVNPNTAVVLFNGRPLVLTDIEKSAPAILEMWFPGSAGGRATANLIFGEANPCGKLSMTFPKAVGQCPVYYNRANTGRPKQKPDGVYEDFISNYIDCGNLPLYFFGYGLSYTDFKYESMTLSSNEMTSDGSIDISIKLKNIGKYPGKETVQLYIRDMVSSTVRPVQELVAFEKTELAPGEEKTVKFTLTENMLRFWNSDNNYVSEPGEFKVSVGYADHMVFTESFYLK